MASKSRTPRVAPRAAMSVESKPPGAPSETQTENHIKQGTLFVKLRHHHDLTKKLDFYKNAGSSEGFCCCHRVLAMAKRKGIGHRLIFSN